MYVYIYNIYILHTCIIYILYVHIIYIYILYIIYIMYIYIYIIGFEIRPSNAQVYVYSR